MQTNLILNEAFYGKNKDLLYIENVIIPKIRKVYLKGKSIPKYCKNEINEMEHIFSKLFGIDKVIIKIGFPAPQMNAFTVTVHMNSKSNLIGLDSTVDDYKMIKTPNGIRYKNTDKEMNIYLLPSLFEYEDSEMTLAIILHEIGHNFFNINNFYKTNLFLSITSSIIQSGLDLLLNIGSPYFKIKFQSLIQTFVTCLLTIFPKTRKLYMKIAALMSLADDFISEKIDIIKFINGLNKIISFLLGVFGIVGVPLLLFVNLHHIKKNLAVFSIIAVLLYLIKMLLPKLVGSSINSLSYKNEIFADSFAASFGYGSAIVKTFGDFNNIIKPTGFKENSFLNQLSKLNWSLILGFQSIFDEHPDNVSRCENIVRKYEYELNNNKELTNAQKNELKKELEKSKNLIKTFKRKDISYMIQDLTFKYISAIKNKYITKITNVDDKDIYDFENTYRKSNLLDESFDLYEIFI